jgi:hypothetical protein
MVHCTVVSIAAFVLSLVIVVKSIQCWGLYVEPPPVWHAGPADLVDVEIARNVYTAWMSKLSAVTHATRSDVHEIIAERPDSMFEGRYGVACGSLQEPLDAWVSRLEAVVDIPKSIRSQKPDLCALAPIRSHRVSGQVHFEDSNISWFIGTGDGIGAAFFLGSIYIGLGLCFVSCFTKLLAICGIEVDWECKPENYSRWDDSPWDNSGRVFSRQDEKTD